MLNRGAIFGIFLISLLVVITSWYAAKLSVIVPFSGAVLTNIGTLEQGVVIQTNAAGAVEYRGTVASASEDGANNIEMSQLQLIDYTAPLPWTLTASSGMLTDQHNLLSLGGGVSLSRAAAPGAPPILVQTERAQINMQKQVVTGQDLITISQPGSKNFVSGVGFKANIASKKMQLLSGVKSVYQLPKN